MFNKVTEFENEIAKFYNAPYAVATDCCTHAIELCLRHTQPNLVSIPRHTYISVPMTAKKIGTAWEWNNDKWQKYYWLNGSSIIDAAVYWQQGGYIPGSYMCLSFQFKKHLSLGRGGAILCDSEEDYSTLKKMSYDGRLPDIPWAEQNITTMGYHYYMTPETAKLGLEKLPAASSYWAPEKSWQDYPDVSLNRVFN